MWGGVKQIKTLKANIIRSYVFYGKPRFLLQTFQDLKTNVTHQIDNRPK